jgi:hypothetical protein
MNFFCLREGKQGMRDLASAERPAGTDDCAGGRSAVQPMLGMRGVRLGITVPRNL